RFDPRPPQPDEPPQSATRLQSRQYHASAESDGYLGRRGTRRARFGGGSPRRTGRGAGVVPAALPRLAGPSDPGNARGDHAPPRTVWLSVARLLWLSICLARRAVATLKRGHRHRLRYEPY